LLALPIKKEREIMPSVITQSKLPWERYLLLTLLLHFTFLTWKVSQPIDAKQAVNSPHSNPLKLRVLGLKDGKPGQAFFSYSESELARKVEKTPYMNRVKSGIDQMEMRVEGKDGQNSKPLDLSQIDFNPKLNDGDLKRMSAVKAIQLRGEEIRNFVKGNQNRYMRSQNITPTLKNSQVAIMLDVPEGIEFDELNELEEMFYSFQKRLALTYVNSFYDNLSDFQMKNPHKHFPMTNEKLTLTARVTFDHYGNIQQIKAVKWSEQKDLQDFFIKVIDKIESVPNPPKDLVKTGTFNVYYTLNLN
jgi:hypothetical protein